MVRGMDPRIQIRIRIHTKMSWIRNPAPRKRFRVLPDVYLVQKGKFYAEASGEELARDPAQLEEDLCDDTHRILQCKLR
jgi:hypothetical protein